MRKSRLGQDLTLEQEIEKLYERANNWSPQESLNLSSRAKVLARAAREAWHEAQNKAYAAQEKLDKDRINFVQEEENKIIRQSEGTVRWITNEQRAALRKLFEDSEETQVRRALVDALMTKLNEAQAAYYKANEIVILEEERERVRQEAQENDKARSFAQRIRDSSQFLNSRADEDYIKDTIYICTVLTSKPDSFGRYYLMDIRLHPYNEKITGYLSGTETPIPLVGVYFDSSEKYVYNKKDYYRQHGGPGARIHGMGLGAPAYMATAYAAALVHDVPGTVSPKDGYGYNRSPEASKLWNAMLKAKTSIRKLVRRMSSYGKTVCVPLPKSKWTSTWQDYDYRLNRTRNFRGTIASDRSKDLCGEVYYEYLSSDGQTLDILSANALIKSPFFVFGPTQDKDAALGRYSRPSFFSSSWKLLTVRDEARRQIRRYPLIYTPDNNREYMKLSAYAGREWFEAGRNEDDLPIVKRSTAYLLARAYHGDSPWLIYNIAATLQRSGYPKLMKAYLMRPDIAPVTNKTPALLELLGQQVIPGTNLFGLDEDLEMDGSLPALPDDVRAEVQPYAEVRDPADFE